MKSVLETNNFSLKALSHEQSRFWMKSGVAATLLFHLLYAAWLLIHPVSRQFTQVGGNVLGTLGAALATLFCFLPVPDSQKQPLWRSQSKQVSFFCGMSMVCYTLQQLYIIYPVLLHHPAPISRFGPDLIAVASYPLLLIGIWRLPRKRLSFPAQMRISLDGLMVTISVLTLSWYFVLGPTVLTPHGTLEGRIIDASYPFMDVLITACLLLLGGGTGLLRSVFRLLAIGLIIAVVTDSAFAYLALHTTYLQGTLIDIGWSLGYMLIGVAVVTGRQAMTFTKIEQGPGRLPSLQASLMPYSLLPLVAALVLYTEQAPGRIILKHGVFWGALALISLVIGRQVLALLENRELNTRLEGLATTDPLTGLVNHRTFHARLAEEAATARAEGQALAVVMLDLDNFKFFNDAYGHAAGDEVLRQVTQALRESTTPQDTVGRFGGDEFALLIPLKTVGSLRQGISAGGVQQSLEASFCELFFLPPGSPSPIPLTVSLGVAVFPEEAATPLEALELADRRLLHFKTGGGTEDSPAEQLCRELTRSLSGFPMLNALVTAVDNKDRYTRRHSEDVLTYSLQIADQFGLDADIRRTIQVAALLHDVGKIGVPDRVLRKPGKLTDEEYEAIQQHPLMGAVIVGAVPGFEETLDAVRHHHERWDGGGYPFGLRGEETPLLARIVSVADAFSAMTTDRPYRKGMEREKALRILEEGAGTQWDPDCVEALLSAYQPAAKPYQQRLLAA